MIAAQLCAAGNVCNTVADVQENVCLDICETGAANGACHCTPTNYVLAAQMCKENETCNKEAANADAVCTGKGVTLVVGSQRWGFAMKPKCVYKDAPTVGVQCCEKNGSSNPNIHRLTKPNKCTDDVSQSAASDLCEEAGQRLCTQDEMEQYGKTDSGCHFDKKFMWTSTPCYNPDPQFEQ
jgi:hypothetical protein